MKKVYALVFGLLVTGLVHSESPQPVAPQATLPAELVEPAVSAQPVQEEAQAPSMDTTSQVQQEEELTEEQLKELLDQIIAEIKKEEEAAKKQEEQKNTAPETPVAA